MANFELIFTALVLTITILAMVFEWFEVDLIMLGTVILLVLGRVITAQDAMSGFSNEAVLTVGMLYVLAAGIQRSGAFEPILGILFGKPKGDIRKSLARVLFPVSLISGVFNDTPLVAILIPIARRWCRKYGVPVSKILMPISFAALFGGMLTLVGTSNNVFVSGLMVSAGLEPLGFFELTPVASAMVLVGVTFIVLFSPKFLPDRADGHGTSELSKEFICSARVSDKYPSLGKTVEAAGLRHLKGLFLFQIIRKGGEVITPVGNQTLINSGDRFFFTGIPETLLELQNTQGLEIVPDLDFTSEHLDSELVKTFEVVISQSSPLVGLRVRDSEFRNRYDAAILAIHRQGGRVTQKIGDIVLKEGDTLLLLAKKDFQKTWKYSPHFYLVSESEEMTGKPRVQSRIAGWLFLAYVVMLTSEKFSPFISSWVVGIMMVATGCLTIINARRSVDLKVLVVIACSIAISKAMHTSGLAALIGKGFASFFSTGAHHYLLLGAVFLVVVLLSLILNTKAASGLVFPITLAMSEQLQLSMRPFALIIILASSTAFLAPVSYQTNLMVAGPGQYQFKDFFRIGLPLTLISGIIAVLLIGHFYF